MADEPIPTPAANTIPIDPATATDRTIQINPDQPAYDPAQDQRTPFQKVDLNPQGPTIAPTPKPSLAQRAVSAVKENIPRYSTRTVYNPKYGKESFESASEALTPEEKLQHPILTGVLEATEDLASPATIGTIAATAGIGEAPAIVAKVASGLFAGQIAAGVYEQYPELKKQMDTYQSAKTPEERADAFAETQRVLTHMGIDSFMALAAGAHAFEGAPDALAKVGAHLKETGKTFVESAKEEGKAALEATAPEGRLDAGFAKLGGKKVRSATPKPTTPEIVDGQDVVEHLMKTGKMNENDAMGRTRTYGAGKYALVDVPIQPSPTKGPGGTIANEETLAGHVQAGDDYNPELAQKYAAKKTPLPAIVLGPDAEVVDGNHRIAAAEIRGDKTIKAYIPVGYDATEAIIHPSAKPEAFASAGGKFVGKTPEPPAELPLSQIHLSEDAYNAALSDNFKGKGSKTEGPISIVHNPETGQYLVEDGVHRLVQAHQDGKESIPVTIRSGSSDLASVRPEERQDLSKIQEPYHPDLQKVIDLPGVTVHQDPSQATDAAHFVTPDGKFVRLPAGLDHDKAIDKVRGESDALDSRISFLNDTGAMRIRPATDRAGKTLHVSVPVDGITPEQIDALKQSVGQGMKSRGNLILETADKPSDVKTAHQQVVSPRHIDDMAKEIGVHPDQVKPAAEAPKAAGMTPEIAQKIVDAHTANGGSTFNLTHGDLAGTDNYAVATHPEASKILPNPPTVKDIQDYAKEHADLLKDPANSLGTWLNPEDNKHYLDISTTLPDREQAIALGKEHNQISIAHLTDFENIPTGGTGKTPNADIPESKQAATFGGTPEAPAAPALPLGNRISSRFPTADRATEDPMQHDLTMSSDMILQQPAIAQRLADKIVAQNKSMVFTPEELKTPKGIFDAFVRQASDNIKAMYYHASPENRIQNRVWYEGANKIGVEDAKKNGLEPRQNWAAIASQSPQKEWDQNVSLYERLSDTVLNKSDVKFTSEMQTKANEFIQDIAAANAKKIAKGKAPTSPWVDKDLIKSLKGKSLSDLSDPIEKAAFVRIYDEAHNPREFHELAPDGTKLGIRKLAGTDIPEKVAWGGLNSIAKGIAVLQDGSLENISKNLGENHKVRSFYNNIAEPMSEHGDVTADTHHVGLSLMRPVAGDDAETKLNFGGNGSTITGVHGSYPLYVDATRRAMHEINAENPNDEPLKYPRQLQSVVWAEWREVFPPEARTPETKAAVDNIWKEHLDGKITADEARKQVFDFADRLRSGVDEGTQGAADKGKLPAHQLSGAGSPRGGGGEPSEGTPAVDEGDTSFNFGENVQTLAEADVARVKALQALKKPGASAPIPTKLKQSGHDNMNDPATRAAASEHEAAHSVISEMLNPGSVNSTGLTSGGGVTDIQPPAGKTTVGQLSSDEVRNIIATSYAGGMSEPGGTTAKHVSGDQVARDQVLGGRASSMWQGIQRLATGGVSGTDPMLQANPLQAEGKARVEALLADPAVQQHIKNVSSHIAARGKLSGDEVRAIMKPPVLTAAK